MRDFVLDYFLWTNSKNLFGCIIRAGEEAVVPVVAGLERDAIEIRDEMLGG
jgi:hypothetical protein